MQLCEGVCTCLLRCRDLGCRSQEGGAEASTYLALSLSNPHVNHVLARRLSMHEYEEVCVPAWIPEGLLACGWC